MVWKDIPGFENLYKINEYGDVYSYRLGRLIIPSINNKGYKTVDLYKNGERNRYFIHRLVATLFVPNPENYPIVLHLDNVKTNTYYTNLKWGTYSENNSQAIKDGLNTVPKTDCRKVYEVYNGNIYGRFLGLRDIIDINGYGNDSSMRNYIFRKKPIRRGILEGCNISLADVQKPFNVGI